MSFSCSDKDTLVAYVYGECDAATRDGVRAHLAACPACAGEVDGFDHVRAALSSWEPPERVGAYKLVREDVAQAQPPAQVLRPARWWTMPLPALARVAAAILLFAGGAALANLEVRYDRDGFMVRTGWTRGTPAAVQAEAARPAAGRPGEPTWVPTVATPPSPAQATTPWRPELASLERQLRDEFRQQLAAATATRSSASATPVSADASLDENRLMSRVHALVDESYHRQQIEMAYRISQVVGEFQAQRKNDILRVQQVYPQLEGLPPSLQPRRPTMMNLFPVSLKK
jgi:anti-sigma factor RsiW